MNDPRIRQTIVRDPNNDGKSLLVSTANTSDHGLETMVFRVQIDFNELDCQRYDSLDQALAGHAAIVARIEGGN